MKKSFSIFGITMLAVLGISTAYAESDDQAYANDNAKIQRTPSKSGAGYHYDNQTAKRNSVVFGSFSAGKVAGHEPGALCRFHHKEPVRKDQLPLFTSL
jgi:hypothetical protein